MRLFAILQSPLELAIFGIILVLCYRRIQEVADRFGGPGGPFTFGFGAVPVDDPPPTRDPYHKPEAP